VALDLGTVRGALEMRNQFSVEVEDGVEQLEKMEEQVTKMGGPFDMFSEDAVESFGSIAKAVGLAVGALTAAGLAIHELGIRGAEVGDIRGAFEDLSGGAAQAEINLKALREGVRGTVDDTELMHDAVRLLSAGVKVGADDFKTMADAAFILADRGLGTTTEMMDIFSQAMITGRTRALATKVGIVDLGDAHAEYAKQLGVDVNMLSETAKAEATRQQVMSILNDTVAKAAPITRDYGDAIDEAKAKFSNWLDDLSTAIHDSPVFQTAVTEIGRVLGEAFGDNKASLIDNIVTAMEHALVISTELGLATVEAARVIYTGWSGVTVVIDGLVGSMVRWAWVTAQVAGASKETVDNLDAIANGMFAQAEAAWDGVKGNSEFHKTLDTVGGKLFEIKDALEEARNKTKESTVATDANTEANEGNAKVLEQINRDLLDQAKMRELEKKGHQDALKLLDEYYNLVKNRSGTSYESQIADIQRWKDRVTQAAKDAHTDTKEFYDALEKLSKEKTDQAGIDMHLMAQGSRQDLQEIALAAQRNFDYAIHHASEFRTGFIAHLRAIRDAAVNDARGMGAAFVGALDTIGNHAQQTADDLDEVAAAARRAKHEVDEWTYELQPGDEGYLPEGAHRTREGWEWNDPASHRGGGSNRGAGEMTRTEVTSPATASSGSTWSGAGGVTNIFHVNGSARENADQIFRIMMDRHTLGRKM
jgi:hypothetical protein